MEMSRRFFILRTEMDDTVLEESDHAVIHIGPLFTGVKKDHSHCSRVLKDANPFEGIQGRRRSLLFRFNTEDPFPHTLDPGPYLARAPASIPFFLPFISTEDRDIDAETE